MKPKLQDIFSRFRRSADGNTAMIFALTVGVVVLITGLALDFARVQGDRASLQAATDASALAIGHDEDVTADNIKQRARDFILANLPSSFDPNKVVVSATEINDGHGVRVSVNANVDTLLLGLLGINQLGVDAVSEATFATTKVELALALDNTGSMSGSKLDTLKIASDNMIDLLLPSSGENDEFVTIGIVPFDLSVNVGTENAGKPWITNTSGYEKCTRYSWINGSRVCTKTTTLSWRGCVAPREQPADIDDRPADGIWRYQGVYDNATNCGIAKLLPLTNDVAALHNEVSRMQANGWTYIPVGLEWGWRLLGPEVPFAAQAGYDNPDWKKILVLMTDGANTVRWEDQNGEFLPRTGVSSTTGDARTKAICANIKDRGITVYTVAFQVSSSSTRLLLRECASDPEKYFDAQNSDALDKAFAKIAGDIISLRLSK